MKQYYKRWLSALLTMAMILTLLPTSALAAETEPGITEEEHTAIQQEPEDPISTGEGTSAETDSPADGEAAPQGSIDTSTAVPIKDALDSAIGTENIVVKGVVTLLDGPNVYIQDGTGAICLRSTAKATDIALGDTVLGQGKRGEFNKLPQLDPAVIEKAADQDMVLTAVKSTIADINAGTIPVCSYVEVTDLKVTKIDDGGGKWNYPTITLENGSDTIQLYKGVVDNKVAVGDTLTVKGAVGIFSKNGTDTMQLRNTTASEITVTASGGGEPEVPVDPSPVDPPAVTSTIADAQKPENNGKQVAVKGVISYINKYKMWIQDSTGKMYLNVTEKDNKFPGSLKLGETITAVGTISNGTISYTTSADAAAGVTVVTETADKLTLTPAEMKISQITAMDRGLYVKLTDLKVTKIDLIGTYKVPMATLTDKDGNSIQWYNPKTKPHDLMLYDEVISVRATVDVHDGNVQLVNCDGSETHFAEKSLDNAPKEGDKVVIYCDNSGAKIVGVLGRQKGDSTKSPMILNSPSMLNTDSKTVDAGNGAHIFEVQKKDGFYRFYNEHDGYLCSKDEGKNLFYTKTPGEGAGLGKSVQCSYWTLSASPLPGGFYLKNEEAKFQNRHAQYLQQYGDGYSTYSSKTMTTDPSEFPIYTFYFYTVSNDPSEIVEQVVNRPQVMVETPVPAYVSQPYTVKFKIDAPFGVKTANVELNGRTYSTNAPDASKREEEYTAEIPAEDVAKVSGDKLDITISCVDTKDVPFSTQISMEKIDIPLLSENTPTGAVLPDESGHLDRRPVISVKVANGGKDFTAKMTLNGQEAKTKIENDVVTALLDKDLEEGAVEVKVVITRKDGKTNELTWSFSIGKAMAQLYFGQLHSHTQYSDGAGSLESALKYVGSTPKDHNVDFVAFTDHSNYFDGKGFGGTNAPSALHDMSTAAEDVRKNWEGYKKAVADFNADPAANNGRVALAGFEMTWSGGPGHINTFNSKGIVSRNNADLNNKTNDAGMKLYYETLKADPALKEGGDPNDRVLSQFNHPGKTFGNFSDFAHWDPAIDQCMVSVEVGNGEGKIHQGGYYPSYEQYTMALDKGWHLAPTNNQDNHKGSWGDANDARNVILTDNFSEQGIYQAMRERNMYATEDKNLELYYTVNGQPMGSILPKETDALNVEVKLHDPDYSDMISKVEIIVNSGRVAHTWSGQEAAAGKLTCTLKPEYTYYYVRVTEADGDLAVTAPVWVGEVLKLGISSVQSDTAVPVNDEPVTVKTTFFNSESQPATVTKITYQAEGSAEPLFVDNEKHPLATGSETTISWTHTFTKAMLYNIQVTAEIEQGGKSFTYSMALSLDVEDASKLVFVGIDGSHYNEYVSGQYKDAMGNFAQLASGYGVMTKYLNTSEALIQACANEKVKMMILTTPSRRLDAAKKDPKVYSADEIAALKRFNERGGIIVVTGWSDNYENFTDLPAGTKSMAETQNELLSGLGSSLRINDDATYDDEFSKKDGVDPWRLYFNTYNMADPLNAGVIYDASKPYDRMYTELFSQYGGSSIYAVGKDGRVTAELPETVSPLIFGHASTYSQDVDGDKAGVVGGQKYMSPQKDLRLMVAAAEQLPGKGMILVSGAAFMSNFEIQKEMDNVAEKNYSNYRICENLVRSLNTNYAVDTIAAVQAEKREGIKFTVEGVVTSNASGHDKNTAFFDCIYLQDDTAGINAFPVDGKFKIGDRVRVTGHTSSYNGERQIAVKQIEKIGEGEAPAPKAVTAAQINDGSVLGSLVKISGTVESFATENGLIQTIMVRDSSGVARVFIDGYITTASEVQNISNGCAVTVVGLASYDNSFAGTAPRIRIRDRADIQCSDPDTPIPPAPYPIPGPIVPPSGETVVLPDGTTMTTTEDKASGTITVTTTKPDGTVIVKETKKDGTVKTVEHRPDGVTVETTTTVSGSTQAEIHVPGHIAEAVVTIPVPGAPSEGQVAIIVGPDGTETIVKTSVPTADGVKLAVKSSVTVRIANNAKSFQDVPPSHWAKGAIDFVTARGIYNGTSDTTFSPQSGMTRGMLAKVLYDLENAPAISVGTAFTDVDSVSWYSDAVAWAAAKGIVKGYEDGTFHQEQVITREQLVTILYRYVGVTGAYGTDLRFTDSNQISGYAKDAVAWAVSQNIIDGVGDGRMDPKGTATRAQAAAIIMRFLKSQLEK